VARIFKRGRKWYVDYRVAGRRVWKSVGTSKRLAEDYLKDLEAKRVRGELMDLREAKSIAFDTFAQKYLERYGPNKAESTRLRDEITVRKHLVPFFGRKLLGQIAAADIEEYKAQRRATQTKGGRQIARSTVNRELDLLKSLFARAVEWGYLKTNPAGEIQKFRVDEKEPRFLAPGEGALLMDAAEGQMKGFVVTALNTGLRKGELFNLRWGDVDFRRRELRVRKAKGKRFRVIPINDLLYETLKKHPRHISGPYIFHNDDGTPWHDVRRSFNAALENAGLPRIRFHDLRHSFVSNLVMAGEDLRTVQELAGHRDIHSTMRYAHLTPGRLQNSVKRLTWKNGKDTEAL